jgi:hypothetical protein
MLPRSAASGRRGDRFTVCMELSDVARDDGGSLVVLAGYPHPTNDWGWSSWDFDGPYLDDSDWNRPWDRQVYLSQITVEPEEVGQTVDDVEWEADHARVLVETARGWQKRALPFPCHRFRRLPGLGLCAVGACGLAVLRGERWEAIELVPGGRPVPCALIDAVADGDRIIGVNRDGGGGVGEIEIAGGALRWRRLSSSQLAGLHAAWSCGGRVLAVGYPGVIEVAGRRVERLVRGQRRGFRTLAGDAECAYAGSASGDIVALPPGGRPRTFGLRFSRAPSMAVLGDRIYASAGRDVRAISRDGRADNVVVPMPGPGSISLRRLGGELFAVCSHHLARGDGASWSLVPFR